MKIGILAKSVWCVAIFALCPIALSALPQLDLGSQETAKGQIDQFAAMSDEVDVYHTPERSMGRLGLNEATATKNWASLTEYRCASSCTQEIPNLLGLLSSARKSTQRVAGDVSTVVLFKRDNKEVGRVVGHWSGRAIKIGTQVYVLDNSLATFLETHSSFQW
ncbi:MAG TPA: hypothetical protein VHZ29_01275 [Rhizomicrobium sp.]|nr:hypothetical protein [Rhizomicrobium sp.]